MNSDVILSQLMQSIQAATVRVDVTEITRLSQLARRVQEIRNQMNSLGEELEKIQAAIQKNEQAGSAASHPIGVQEDPVITPAIKGDVVVELDWALCGINRPKAKISESRMSETLVGYVAELKAALGADALEKLASFKISRGPLISKRPAVDFNNRSTGLPYAHHQLEGTGYHVLTHSSTAEKVDAIRESWRFLGLPEGALSLRRI